MSTHIAFVTVRASSSRLPNKCFETITGDLSAIQVVIRRALRVGCRVVLATTTDPSDDRLESLAKAEGIDCFRGALRNKIKRWADGFARYQATAALLVDGDDPTFDYRVGARALEMLDRGETELITSSPELTPGFFTYGITRTGMDKLLKQAPDPTIDTDVITEFINRAGLVKSFVPAAADERGGHGLRLTIDYPEDVEFYRELYRRVDYLAPSPDIVQVALENDLRRINWHRHQEFLENQNKFNEGVRQNG